MKKPVKVSGIVITYNEEKNLARCLESMISVVDEIIIVDSYSKDNTEAIARQYGAIFLQNPFEGHIEQKNFALQQASYEYVLSLDADEALSEKLATSIRKAKENPRFDGYEMNRLNNYCGQWIRHGGWYPDRKLRLFKKLQATWGGYNPHDKVEMKPEAKVGFLKGELLHYTYDPEDRVLVVTEHTQQINTFATRWAQSKIDSGKKVWPWFHLVLVPIWVFWKEYLFRLGLLDGFYGFVIAKSSAYHKYLKYLKLYEMRKQQKVGMSISE